MVQNAAEVVDAIEGPAEEYTLVPAVVVDEGPRAARRKRSIRGPWRASLGGNAGLARARVD